MGRLSIYGHRLIYLTLSDFEISVITVLGIILNNLAAVLANFINFVPLIFSGFYYCSNLGAFIGTLISFIWNF